MWLKNIHIIFISVTDTYLLGIDDAAFLEAERVLCRSTGAVKANYTQIDS